MRMPVSQVMLKPAGIRMRMSSAAVIVGVPASSVMVIRGVFSESCPTIIVLFCCEEMVGAGAGTISIVLSSVAITEPSFATSSSRLSAAETAVKLAKLKSAMVIWSPAAKSVVTSTTRVWPPSS